MPAYPIPPLRGGQGTRQAAGVIFLKSKAKAYREEAGNRKSKTGKIHNGVPLATSIPKVRKSTYNQNSGAAQEAAPPYFFWF